MSFTMWGQNFEGTFASESQLSARPGVFVVWSRSHVPGTDSWVVLDVDDSDNVMARAFTSDRRACWLQHLHGGHLAYAAHYTEGMSADERKIVATSIRTSAKPTCC